MKSLMISSFIVFSFIVVLTIPQTDAGTADIWKLCQSSSECYYCLTYYCTQDTGSWGWRTSGGADICDGNSDGWYCNVNVRENRDYGCNTGGTCTAQPSPVCTYTVSSSEDCSTKASTDTDAGDVPLTAGTVTDYAGCSGGSCTSNTYSDSCSVSTLTEYYPSGASYSSTPYNCESYESLYCNIGNGDIYRNEWQCSGTPGYCNNGAADSVAEDCSNTCSDTDYNATTFGNDPLEAGTVTDDNLCSIASQTSCPSSTSSDSCSGVTLTEYYCSGNDYTSRTENCNTYDTFSYNPPDDTCSWDDYGCPSDACTVSASSSLDCDTYDSVSGSTANDYEVSGTSCTLGCTGTGCCYVDNTPNTCSAATSCQPTTVEGNSYKCHQTNGGVWQWDSGTLPAETACSDTYDNDCDGLIDNDDSTNCDSTPPTGSVSMNGGAVYTTSTSVTLTLSCTDTQSGCAEMRFSNDGSTWSTQTYSTGASWTLPSGDGTKTVYARFKDGAGNWMTSSVNDPIILDTGLPISSISILASCRATTSFPLSWSGSDTGSGLANYDIQYKKNAGDWANCLTSTALTTITFPLGCSFPSSVANGDTFYFQSRARDNAGNLEPYPATYDTSTTIDQSGPNPPYNLLPSDGMVTSDNTPDFSWQPSADNGCSNSVSGYEIQIGSSCGSGPTYFASSTTYTPSTLADGAYYWRAIAKDGFGTWGSWSSCNQITIDTTVSASISINTPPNNIVTNNPTVTFYLSYPTDADKCRYSNDGAWDTELWETCAATKSWTLTSGYETKIIYFQVKDKATPPNTGQASDSIDYAPDSSFAAGGVNVEGTKDFLHISWDINGFRTRDLMIDCELNNDPTQTCSIQQKQGKGSCSIVNPAYDFTINENSVECTASYKDNPTISATASKNFKLIDFQVSAPSSLTAIIGEQTEVELTIKNQGILQDSYSLTASVEPPALAGKFNLRESSITTSNVNPNKTTAASFFITPLIETAGSPNLKITAASSVSPAKSQEIPIPIKTIKIVIGLPEFHLLGLVQIILLALFLFYFSLKKPIIKNKP